MEALLILLVLALLGYVLIAPAVALYRSRKAREEAGELRGTILELHTQIQSLRNRLEREPSSGRQKPMAEEEMARDKEHEPISPAMAVVPPPELQAAVVELKAETEAASAMSVRTEVKPPPLPGAARPESATLTRPEDKAAEPAWSGVSLEQFLGVKLFAWIGGLALFLGIVFFVKYAFERNLISPALRTTIGFLIGGGLVGAGVFIRRSETYRVLSQTLAATGVLILYGVTFAAHALYHFPAFGTLATFGYMSCITVLAFVLAVRMDAQVIAVLGMAGGFLTPMVVNSGEDNPFGLFGYVALLDVGLMAVARTRGWSYLLSCAAGGTVLLMNAWFIKFFGAGHYAEGPRIWTPLAVHLFFPALFAGATAWQRRGRPESLHPAAGGLAVGAWGFMVGFVFLGYAAITSRPGVLYGYLFALNALVLAQVWLQPRMAAAQWVAAVATFIHLAVWSSKRLTEETLLPALVCYLVFGLMHTGFALLAMRKRPEAMAAQRHGVWLGPVAVLLVMVPVFTMREVSWMIWPTILLLDLMTIAVAALTLSLVPVLLALCVTLVAVGIWLFRLAPDAGMFGFLFVLGGFAMLFAAAGALLSFRLRQKGASRKLAGADWLVDVQGLLPIMSAALPFILLIIATQRLQLANPSSVFALGLLLAVFLLAMMRVARLPSLGAASLVCMAALECEWFITRFSMQTAWTPLLWFIGVATLFAGYAFLWRQRFRDFTLPWIVSACSWLVHFPLVYLVIKRAFPNDFMGLVPAAFAVPVLVSLAVMLKQPAPAESGTRTTQIAWFGGVALFFITLIFPVQYERQWITLGWALEGAALCWLFTRVPHHGLRGVGLVLLATSFVRLALNPAVLTYHERSGTPVWNWFLYTYLIAAAAQFAAAWWLAPPRHELGGKDVRVWLWTCGGILLFLLLNIEIADAFTTPDDRFVAFTFGGNFGRDMTYSIAWALFALALLVIGFIVRARGARYAGIGLMAVTLLKLFFHDLANIGSIYRIAALIVVAMIALGASFLYQRFYASERK